MYTREVNISSRGGSSVLVCQYWGREGVHRFEKLKYTGGQGVYRTEKINIHSPGKSISAVGVAARSSSAVSDVIVVV